MEGLIPEIERRRAYRALDERKVPREVVERIMKGATYAPSCSNNQPWRFVVADGEPALSQVKQGLSRGNYWARKAPLIVLVLTREDLDARLSDGRKYALFDTGMAAMALQLQAVHEGLYAHPIAGFDPVAVKKSMGIPDDFTLVTLINIGYPGPEDHLSAEHKEREHSPRARKEAAEVISWNHWFG